MDLIISFVSASQEPSSIICATLVSWLSSFVPFKKKIFQFVDLRCSGRAQERQKKSNAAPQNQMTSNTIKIKHIKVFERVFKPRKGLCASENTHFDSILMQHSPRLAGEVFYSSCWSERRQSQVIEKSICCRHLRHSLLWRPRLYLPFVSCTLTKDLQTKSV